MVRFNSNLRSLVSIQDIFALFTLLLARGVPDVLLFEVLATVIVMYCTKLGRKVYFCQEKNNSEINIFIAASLFFSVIPLLFKNLNYTTRYVSPASNPQNQAPCLNSENLHKLHLIHSILKFQLTTDTMWKRSEKDLKLLLYACYLIEKLNDYIYQRPFGQSDDD